MVQAKTLGPHQPTQGLLRIRLDTAVAFPSESKSLSGCDETRAALQLEAVCMRAAHLHLQSTRPHNHFTCTIDPDAVPAHQNTSAVKVAIVRCVDSCRPSENATVLPSCCSQLHRVQPMPGYAHAVAVLLEISLQSGTQIRSCCNSQ